MIPSSDFQNSSAGKILIDNKELIFKYVTIFLLGIWLIAILDGMMKNNMPFQVIRGTGYQENIYYVYQSNGNISVCSTGISPTPITAKCDLIGNFKN